MARRSVGEIEQAYSSMPVGDAGRKCAVLYLAATFFFFILVAYKLWLI